MQVKQQKLDNKAIVILTNFWSANTFVENGCALLPINKEKILKIDLTEDYIVQSIALSHPPLNKLQGLHDVYGDHLSRIDFFCPTYNMLSRYKQDGDWKKYSIDYKRLLVDRKDNIKDWLVHLRPEKTYVLCCWENISRGSHCHRELIYKAMLGSAFSDEKAFYYLHDGGSFKLHSEFSPETNVVDQYRSSYIRGTLTV